SLRVPVGNAAGDQFSSWLNPTSLLIGVLAVVTAAYLAAVFLCADAARLGEPGLERALRSRAVVPAASLAAFSLCADAARLGEPGLERKFRPRALAAGLVSGAIALGG